MIAACCLGSLGLNLLESNDLRIIKVIVFSRAVTNAAYLFGELSGLYRPVESSKDSRKFTFESLLALCVSVFLCYTYIYEVKQMPSSFVKSFIAGTNMTKPEKALFDSFRAIREIELRTR